MVRRMRFGIALLAGVTAVSSVHAQQQGQFLVSFVDSQGQSVAAVAPSDLFVFENGQPAKVLKIEPHVSAFQVTLALDNGRSMGEVLVHERAAAKSFLNALPPSIEAALVTSAPVPRFVVKMTKDRAALLKAVDSIAPDSSQGRTVEALQDVSRTWRKMPAGVTPVLVLVGSTFAAELVNKDNLTEALDQLQKSKALVHSVIFKPANATEGDAQLEVAERAARATRGRFERIGSYLQFTVLEDLAKDLTKSASNGQFMVTIERPAGATGKLGGLSLSSGAGITPGRITPQ